MQFVNRKKLSSAVAAVTIGIGCANSARGLVPEYTILDLNTLGGTTSDANGINNAGQVIGTALTGTGATRAFLTSPNAAINPATDALPLLSGGSLNKAYGVNASGQVAGWGSSSSGDRAYRYSGGASATFAPIAGNFSYGQAVNLPGLLVGTSSTKSGNNPGFHATLWSGSTVKDLGATVSGDNSYAYGINSNGSIVGYSADEGSFSRADAFLWTPTTPNTTTGTMVALSNTLGGNFAYAYGINDAGQIVGEATGSGDSPSHAFLRSVAGTMQDLSTLGGTSSTALALNSAGLVVGNARTAAAIKHAFLYDDGAMRDLNNLIPAGSGWTLATATGINDGDQIVGSGTINGNDHAFLLTPLPTWAVNNDGSWSTASNWLGGIPSGSGAEVRLTGAILTAHTVTLDSPRTIGHLVFDNANRYTIAGSATLTINGASATAGIEVRSGNHTIGAPVTFTSTATISLAASCSLKLSGLVKGPIKSLQLGTNATLDLTNNNLVIDYAPADGSPIATLTTALGTGRNGGLWNGTGIISSTAASDATHKTAIGSAEASALGIGSFLGQSVDSTTVLLRYTLNGDANLDGTVNALDFNRLATNFGASNRGWADGNFDYAGTVNTTDFNLLAANFGASMPPPTDPLGALVPEPICCFLLSWALLMNRRRLRP